MSDMLLEIACGVCAFALWCWMEYYDSHRAKPPNPDKL